MAGIIKVKMRGMKVRYTGKTRALELTQDKTYDVLSIERGWYRIETDKLGDYLYPPDMFEVMEAGEEA